MTLWGRLLPASPQVRRILLAKGLRAFGDGFVSVLLPLYLLELGYRPLQVGIIATATLLGSGALTLAVGLRAHRFAYRTLLLAATALMAATGLGFALRDRVLAAARHRRRRNAQSVERRRERVPAARACRAVAARRRRRAHGGLRALQPRRLGRRGGGLGGRRGAGAARARDRTVDRARRSRRCSSLYALLARARRRSPTADCPHTAESPGQRTRSTAARIEDSACGRSPRCSASTRSAAASSCSRWSRCGSTSASGCRSRPRALFFFWTGLLSALSFLVAVRIAGRIGLVNTMVFTHLPANVCLVLVPFMPDLRVGDRAAARARALSQMDVPTRSSYVMAIVPPAERPGGGERHLGAAQPRVRREPVPRRLAADGLDVRLAAACRGRHEDRLRPAAARAFSARCGRRRRRVTRRRPLDAAFDRPKSLDSQRFPSSSWFFCRVRIVFADHWILTPRPFSATFPP